MSPKQRAVIFSCIIILSAVSLFWLTAHIFANYPWMGEFQQRDPDSMLFARLLEQAILRGHVSDTDNYGCFPYEIKHGFAPFYLYFLANTTNLLYQIFPLEGFDPIVVAGFLPILFAWLTSLLITLIVWRIATDSRLILFCAFFMLPGLGASFTAELLKLDYDFLISFFIWLWLLLCSLFFINQKAWYKIAAGITVSLFAATWSGTPFFFFFATLYGLAIWLWHLEEAKAYNEFAFSSMLIGGLVNVVFIFAFYPDSAGVSLSKYSLFQPLCLVVGGLFLFALNALERFKRPRISAFILLFLLAAMVVSFFGEQLMQSTGLLFQKDPVHETISELASLISFSDLGKIAEITKNLTNYMGWPVIFLLFLLVLPLPGINKPSGRLLKNWLVLVTFLSIYQVRFFRWPGIGLGLFAGFVAFLLWDSTVERLKNCPARNFKLILMFLPMSIIFSLQSFYHVHNAGGLADHQIEAFNWITRNTPPTSGYADEKKPEYSILSYWDEGNLLSYYTKRPVAVNNAMWGFKTMADIFSSQNEDDAFRLCEEYGVRYVYLSTHRQYTDKSYGLWPFFKDLPKKPEYVLQYKEVKIEKEFNDWFYFWLLDNLALTAKGKFAAGTRFRVIFAAKADKNTLAPCIIYERVAGAKVNLEVDPGSVVTISLEIKISSQELVYKVHKTADKDGKLTFTLPYSTDHHGGRVITDNAYKIGLFKSGQKVRASVRVTEDDVLRGLVARSVEQPAAINDDR